MQVPKGLDKLKGKSPIPITDQLITWLMGCAGGCAVFLVIDFAIFLAVIAVSYAITPAKDAGTPGMAWGGLIGTGVGLVVGMGVVFIGIGVAEGRRAPKV